MVIAGAVNLMLAVDAKHRTQNDFKLIDGDVVYFCVPNVVYRGNVTALSVRLIFVCSPEMI